MSDGKSKELRTELTWKEHVLMVLMPVSSLVSWSAVLYTAVDDTAMLLRALHPISVFYVLWALRNKYAAGNVKEQGHLTYGTVFLGAVLNRPVLAGAGCMSVAGSVMLVLATIGGWPYGKLAHVMKKTYTWAIIFHAYLCSTLVLNCVVVGLLARNVLKS